jgi:hypothetical protein
MTQSATYAAAGPFPNSTTEEALDKLTRITQELAEKIDRAPKLQLTSGETGLPFPDVATSNGLRALVLNEDEDALEWGPSTDDIEDAEAYALAAAASAAAAAASAAAAAVSALAAAAGAGDWITDTFTGDGSDTTFVLSYSPSSENNTIVTIDGVYQPKSTYSLSGATITFSEAPLLNSVIEVVSTIRGTMASTPSATTVTSAIANNQTAASVPSLLFAGAVYRTVHMRYSLRRYHTGPSLELVQSGFLMANYDTTNTTWAITEFGRLGEAGVTFDINTTSGQILYTSDNQAGTLSVSKMDTIVDAQGV